jgi:hypothetical protein
MVGGNSLQLSDNRICCHLLIAVRAARSAYVTCSLVHEARSRAYLMPAPARDVNERERMHSTTLCTVDSVRRLAQFKLVRLGL